MIQKKKELNLLFSIFTIFYINPWEIVHVQQLNLSTNRSKMKSHRNQTKQKEEVKKLSLYLMKMMNFKIMYKKMMKQIYLQMI